MPEQITRHPEVTMQVLESGGAHDGLARVLDGAERLFLLTGNSADMVREQKNAIVAAQAAGVRHVVKLSALGASEHSNSVIGLWHRNVERLTGRPAQGFEDFARDHASQFS